jgi:glycosyltransferase involved in cell wall biosynthesis
MVSGQQISIVINNYNYASFLDACISSAIEQQASSAEIIVVDDGSTDHSREVIESFGSLIKPIFKQNGGQASALNRGYAASRGDVIIFLDADDLLVPRALENITPMFERDNLAKVHWPLWIIDENGGKTGARIPSGPLPKGDFRSEAIERGPSCVYSPPTSGNAWKRRFLEKVMPIPEAEFRLCADDYLFSLVPAFGEIRAIDEPLSLYRLHSTNNYQRRSFEERLDSGLKIQEYECNVLKQFLQVDDKNVRGWKQHLWFFRLRSALDMILSIIPSCATFVLIDGNEWGTGADVFGRNRLLFCERGGEYWGAPADDDLAIKELEKDSGMGAAFLVVAWPAFWWLNHYRTFAAHLEETYGCLHRDRNLVIYSLAVQEAIA